MCRFKRDLVNAVLRGKRTAVIPYDYPVPPSKQARAECLLGRPAREVFHTEPWCQVSDPHYVGANLWDTEEQAFPQPAEEFEMLHERFKDWLPARLPEGARISPFGVVSYQPPGTVGHLRTLINPLANVQRVAELDKYPFPSTREEWRWEGVEQRVRDWQARGYVVMGGLNIVLDYINFLFGMERHLMAMQDEDPVVRAVWDWMEQDRVYVAQRDAAMGVDCLINGDHVATQQGPMMSRQTFRKWVLPCYEHILSAARSINPDLPWIWHTDGNNDNYIHGELMAIGVSVFNPVECEDPWSLKERYGDRIVLWGTGNWQIMQNGSPDDVRAMVADRISLARRYGGIILNANATPGTPVENLIAFCQAAEEC